MLPSHPHTMTISPYSYSRQLLLLHTAQAVHLVYIDRSQITDPSFMIIGLACACGVRAGNSLICMIPTWYDTMTLPAMM